MKKLLSVSLAIISIATCFAGVGCGGGNASTAGGAQKLQIYVLEQGYGRDWAENTKTAFMQQDWVKEKYPELEVELTINDNIGFASNQMQNGAKYNGFDILFGTDSLSSYYGTGAVLDLTESVYNKEVPGEDVLYKDKLNESAGYTFAKEKEGEMHYYATPYFIGQYGIIYNINELKKYTTEVPRTTDELIAICKKIKQSNKYAFVWGNDASYWSKEGGILEVLWAQYNGVEAYDNYFNGVDRGALSVNIFKQKGRLYALEFLSEILNKNNGYYDVDVVNNDAYTLAQQKFYLGQAVFHYNGDYFIDENKESFNKLQQANMNPSEVTMMRTPILSKVIDLCETIENDAELSALVKAIDNGSTELEGEGYEVNQDDFDKILEARGIVGTVGPAPAIIPSYADAKDVAIDFLRFMATDEGIVQYAKGTNGSTIDFKCDLEKTHPDVFNSLSRFHKERLEYVNAENLTISVLRKGSTYPLGMYGGVGVIAAEKWHNELMSGRTAQSLFDETLAKWDSNSFNAALAASGIR